MGKHYLILNFTDYKSSSDLSDTRTTPVTTLTAAIERRVQRKGGSFVLFNMCDLLASVRLESETGPRPYGPQPHELMGLLDIGTIRRVWAEFAIRRPLQHSRLVSECLLADKIIFSAHGLKDDTDNIYCDHNQTFVRCGDVEGMAHFLNVLLSLSGNTDPTITLVVCFAARIANHAKHHVNDVLSAGDIRSSLAFKLFEELSSLKPGVRLTARTGAMSAENTGTSLLSETEEAIIAAETIETEFPGNEEEQIVSRTAQAYNAFDRAIGQSNLTADEKTQARNYAYRWFTSGFDTDDLDLLIRWVEQHHEANKSKGWKLFEYYMHFVAGAAGTLVPPDFSFEGQFEVEQIRQLAPRRRRLHQLKTQSQEELAKYGKFVYQRDFGAIVVSRWVSDGVDGYQLAEVLRL